MARDVQSSVDEDPAQLPGFPPVANWKTLCPGEHKTRFCAAGERPSPRASWGAGQLAATSPHSHSPRSKRLGTAHSFSARQKPARETVQAANDPDQPAFPAPRTRRKTHLSWTNAQQCAHEGIGCPRRRPDRTSLHAPERDLSARSEQANPRKGGSGRCNYFGAGFTTFLPIRAARGNRRPRGRKTS